MPYRLPHKNDRPSARENRLVIEQLRRDAPVNVPALPDLYRPGQAFIAQIDDVTESSGHVFYDWQALAVTYSATGEATYTELGILGNNENYPYLVDIGHETDDPAIFSIGDRVVVDVIDGHEGLAYVINSKILGGESSAIEVDKQYEYTKSSGSTVTLDGRNWLGRVIWYTLYWNNWEEDLPNHVAEDDDNYAGSTTVGAYYAGSEATGEIDILEDGDAAPEQLARLYIDGDANGELKVEFSGAGLGNGMNWRFTVRGYQRLEGGDYIQITD